MSARPRAPTSYDAALIAARMLWPADEGTRQAMLNIATIELLLLSGNHPQPETPSERAAFFRLIRDTPGLASKSEEIKSAFRDGMIAGAILLEALNKPKPTATIKKRIARAFVGEQRVSVSTIDNRIWRDYRCVAAYWAAYLALDVQSGVIPCRAADLPRFLALADDFRRRGEVARSNPKSPETLLRAGETIAVF